MKSEVAKSFTLGFLLFAATEASWLALVMFTGDGSRWVMETPALFATLAVHFVGAAAFSAFAAPSLRGCTAFTTGVAAALIVTLSVVGPGNLGPIVFVIDLVVLTPLLAAGLFIGALLRPRGHHAA